jgi:ABC-type uncharacterized transport system substrate-binding protein
MVTAACLRSSARATPLVLMLCGYASIADAHPHVWVAARSEIVFDRDHKLSAIRQTWTFDQEYSAFAVLGLDTHRDHKPDSDKLAELARTNLASLAEWNWFTGLKVNGVKAIFVPPVEPSQTYADGRLTLSFLLPLKVPTAVKVAALEIDDPSFFVAFNLADAPDAIHMVDAPSGCSMTVHRPEKPAVEGVQILADAVAQTLAANVDAASVGADFTPRALVACP